MSRETARRISALGDLFQIVHWTNSPSILAHPNTVLFISHCGGNGISEAVALGKPIIGLPLFGGCDEFVVFFCCSDISV